MASTAAKHDGNSSNLDISPLFDRCAKSKSDINSMINNMITKYCLNKTYSLSLPLVGIGSYRLCFHRAWSVLAFKYKHAGTPSKNFTMTGLSLFGCVLMLQFHWPGTRQIN